VLVAGPPVGHVPSRCWRSMLLLKASKLPSRHTVMFPLWIPSLSNTQSKSGLLIGVPRNPRFRISETRCGGHPLSATPCRKSSNSASLSTTPSMPRSSTFSIRCAMAHLAFAYCFQHFTDRPNFGRQSVGSRTALAECRTHKSLKGTTPAMANNLATHAWSVRELNEKVMGS
jgi:hypothetical protein